MALVPEEALSALQTALSQAMLEIWDLRQVCSDQRADCEVSQTYQAAYAALQAHFEDFEQKYFSLKIEHESLLAATSGGELAMPYVNLMIMVRLPSPPCM